MSFELEGTLLKKFDTQQVKDNFQKREVVVETDEQYPQQIKVEFIQDKCTLLDDYNEGDRVKVHFNLRGREWNGADNKMTGSGNFPPPSEEPQNDTTYNDDLPF